jgi:ABC-type transport system involved in multi-copper enzyme maturation permease subunit
VFAQTFQAEVLLCSLALMALPFLIGLFWGAPLVAQEYEAGTHRLIWNQSVSRTRWLVTKLTVILMVALTATGLLSLLLTWAASRYDQVQGKRFDLVSFASRNVAPLGHVAFALVLGVFLGFVLRRVVPAMALTFALLCLVGALLPTVIRPHLLPPVTVEVAFDAETMHQANGLAMTRDGASPVVIIGYSLPGALMLDEVSPLLTAAGDELLSADAMQCAEMSGPRQGPRPDAFEQCLIDLDLHLSVEHQPAERYWPFQWLEVTWFLGLSAVLSAVLVWRIRR